MTQSGRQKLSVVACRLGHVSRPVKCGCFTEGPEGVTPLLARLSRLVSGVTVLQKRRHERTV